MNRRREYFLNLSCAFDGCKERSFYKYTTKRDYDEGCVRNSNKKWHCTRHSGDDLLTPQRLTASRTVTSGKSKRYPELPQLFWDDCSGFAHGSSWKAFAEDFPEGTKIIETVQVILPEDKK